MDDGTSDISGRMLPLPGMEIILVSRLELLNAPDEMDADALPPVDLQQSGWFAADGSTQQNTRAFLKEAALLELQQCTSGTAGDWAGRERRKLTLSFRRMTRARTSHRR
jgi:hypothetical protein